MTIRRTLVVSTPFAGRIARLAVARAGLPGARIMTIVDLASRLAGSFLQVPTRRALQEAVTAALLENGLGDLDEVRDLPGMSRAGVTTLNRAWAAGIDLSVRQDVHPRRGAVSLLEERVLDRLPASMRRPSDIASLARANLSHAAAVLGPTVFERVPDLDPCWRDLIVDLANHVEVTWRSGTRPVPPWIEGTAIRLETTAACEPAISGESCASPRHEALEAVRWARALMATGVARPEEIAIAAADPSDWDAHILALSDDANIDIHFAHGRPVTGLAEGQACAALADILLNGLTQDRVRRLVSLTRGQCPAFDALPDDWHRALPPDAPLLTLDRWRQALDKAAADGHDVRVPLLGVLERLEHGAAQALETGTFILRGLALAIWQKALEEGPANALDITLQTLRTSDGLEPGAHVAWMRADDLASAPRPFARLLGLTSHGWPRRQSEDPLLPDHVVRARDLDPVPIPERDRRDFAAIIAAVEREVMLSRSRRGPDGRLLGASPLWPEDLRPVYRRRSRVPAQVASEADRLLARPLEFARRPIAAQATACWQDWHSPELSAHDGVVRPNHPVLLEALRRTQSATSLRRLLRDPIGYVWTYALGWKAPAEEEEPLSLDQRAFGELVHQVLEQTVQRLERGPGLAAATPDEMRAVIDAVSTEVAATWEQGRPTPPGVIWRRTQRDAAQMAFHGLSITEDPLAGQSSWPEVPFGRPDWPADLMAGLPWDPHAPVTIPGTDIAIAGLIDRLDLSGNRTRARVTDYKTGKVPRGIASRQLNGGGELQRCLYGYAVRALVGPIDIEARLVYPIEPGALYPMTDTDAQLETLTRFVEIARASFAAGTAVIGPDSHAEWNDFAFALPGNAKARYFRDKEGPARAALGELPELWEMP